ncbi:MAG: biotin transporter BioY [Cellulosilyticaceae bacterium]
MKITTKEMTIIGLSAALMGVFAQLSIPLPTVPLTLQVFGITLIAAILGPKLASISMMIYILLGAVGVPVFANFRGGLSVLIGPTGGYITGFMFIAICVGYASRMNKLTGKIILTYIGLLTQYTIGTIQLKIVLGVSLGEALVIGVYPFIIKDIVLVGIVLLVGSHVKKRINRFVQAV